VRLGLGRKAPPAPPAGTRVALLLPSGRSLPAGVRRVDEAGGVELDLPAVASLAPGTPLELRWPSEGGWCSLPCAVAPASRSRSAPLRLVPTGKVATHRDRRGDARRVPVLVVLVRVVRSAAVMPGEEERAWLADVSPGGLAFASELAFEPGDVLHVTVVGEGGARLADAPATVVRRERAPGALEQRIGVRVDGGRAFEDAVRQAGA
jgi:hypothetical protein